MRLKLNKTVIPFWMSPSIVLDHAISGHGALKINSLFFFKYLRKSSVCVIFGSAYGKPELYFQKMFSLCCFFCGRQIACRAFFQLSHMQVC